MDNQDSTENATDDALTNQAAREQALEAAVGHHQQGDFEAAENGYVGLLEAMPCDPMALHFLGLLRHHQGRGDDAERLIGRSLVFAPDYLEALNNLGNVFNDRGKSLEAARCFERALDIKPDFLSALNNLAVVLRKIGALEESLSLSEKAVEHGPEFYEGHHNLGMTLRTMGRHDDAVVALKKAAKINKGFLSSYNLGLALYSSGRLDDAREAFEQILEDDPENPLGLHMVAATSGSDNIPDRASDDYVKAVFDGFATSFDATLKGLRYRVPEYLGALVTELYGEPAGALDILDLGCGTGLCGVHTKAYAKDMTGIDLSAGMLREAVHTRAYDDLQEAEITQYLNDCGRQFDLLMSGDTIIYFGELTEVFRAARNCMMPNARFIFSLEAFEEDEGFVLRPHGRYAHSVKYLETEVAEAGLAIELRRDVELRVEGGVPVSGYLISLRLADSV